VNIDLIYGLPKQTVAGFGRTLDEILRLAPERIALYHYAHLPTVFAPQQRIVDAELPSSDEKLALFTLAMERLQAAGYVYIGMDHFAKPDDELAVAQREGRLHRNFQGYSTRADLDLIGVGVSSISKVGDVYSQNAKTMPEYYAAIDAGQLPVVRGYVLDADDRIRRTVIQRLMCDGYVDKTAIDGAYGISFDEYFADDLRDLHPLEKDGLVELDGAVVRITDAGRLLLRRVCMAFDRHLRSGQTMARYSKVA
jgi:oxygen-independent coproporphyrinogen III oxidase